MELSIVLLSCSLLWDIIVIRKIFRGRDLNLFDIITLFYSIYFVLIPIKGILTGGFYREESIQEIVTSSFLPPLFIFLFKFIFQVLGNYVNKYKKNSYLNITRYIKTLNVKITLAPNSIYLFIIVFLLALKPIISYGNLSEDNIEGNLTYFYGSSLPLHERLLANMISGAMPAFVLLSIKYHFEVIEKKYLRLSYINLALMVACSLLAGRTNCFNIVVIILLYIYSCKKQLLTIRNLSISALGLAFMAFFYFPLYQSFRMAKDYVVTNFTSHDFIDVASYFFSMNPNEFVDLYEDATSGSKQRSFNVYMAFYEACTKQYESTKGSFVFENIMCLNPLQSPDASKSNVYAELLEGGGDIAESLPTVLFADIGITFIIVCPLFYVIFWFLIRLICRLANSLFKTPEISFLFISLVLIKCMTIEGGIHIREAYNPDVIVIFVYSFILRVFNILLGKIVV